MTPSQEVKQMIASTAEYNEQMGGHAEALDEVNDAARQQIADMKAKHGDAWLGSINLYKDTRDKPCIWQWDGGMVYNFGACFVIPAYDAELERLILERDRSQYTSTADDWGRLKLLFARIEALGGIALCWS